MMITLKDNDRNKIIEKQKLNLLLKFSNNKINVILENNPDLFLFPSQSSSNTSSEIFNSELWKINGNEIVTNNIMGFIGIDKCNIKISSRFTKNTDKDYFLHYLLQKVFLGHVTNLEINHNAKDNIWEYLYYLFPYYLKRSFAIGLYKEYVNKKYNNMNVRGRIDINQNLKNNIPFQYKVAYNTKEHSLNNKITQLIRHTIEYIKTLPFGHHLLYSNFALKFMIEQIEQVTPNYHSTNRQSIIHSCQQKIKNPYWVDYEILRKICLKILNRDKVSLSGTKEKVCGILFDGAWLWEEYLATILPNEKFVHPNNRSQKGKIFLTKNNRMPRYPDFYTKDKKTVLDAKYKKNISDNREDIHQIITYMYTLEAKHGILIYPNEKYIKDVNYELNGYGGYFTQKFFIIPTDENISFELFSREMAKAEQNFLEQLI